MDIVSRQPSTPPIESSLLRLEMTDHPVRPSQPAHSRGFYTRLALRGLAAERCPVRSMAGRVESPDLHQAILEPLLRPPVRHSMKKATLQRPPPRPARYRPGNTESA